jgi:hypothetical protein
MSETEQDLTEIGVDELEALLRDHGSGLSEAQLRQTRVPLGALEVLPQVFQPRMEGDKPWEKERHRVALTQAVKRRGALDPIVIFPVAGRRIVVDGHCRLEAYRRAGWKESRKVPVRYLAGTLGDALMAAAETNSKDKQTWTPDEKKEYAWRLVKFDEGRGCFSLRDIARTTGAGKSTVGIMRAALDGSVPFDPRGMTWGEVKAKRRGLTPDDQAIDAWHERQRVEWANRLHKTFGDKPNGQPELFLGALEEAYPRLWDALIEGAAREAVKAKAEEILEEERECDF